MSARKRITIFPASGMLAEERLLRALAELFPVDFAGCGEASLEKADAAIFFSGAADARSAFERGVSSFVFDPSTPRAALSSGSVVSLSNCARIHPAFRNARLPAGDNTGAGLLSPAEGENVLASCGGRALWTVREEQGIALHRSTLPVPHLGGGELLWSFTQPGKWMRLAPLLHFLSEVAADARWAAPRQRACFIFDDPNLHAQHYGYIDFAKLAAHATAHNYHVALATVPIDAFYAAPKAVELFRGSRRLSLLIHGNDHVRDELARDITEPDALRLLGQALSRVSRFENRTALSVARVVAAPHSACTEFMMCQMMRLAIDGACISVPWVLRLNSEKSWLASFGLHPTSMMAGGFPIVHRVHLRDGLLPLRFAAFLGQPIIPYGHHQDCAAGLTYLAEIADAVNSWGPVEWCGFDALFRGLYRTRREGDALRVEMWSRQVNVSVPGGVTTVIPSFAGENAAECEVGTAPNDSAPRACRFGTAVAVVPGSLVRMRIGSFDPVDITSVGRRGYRPWPPIRRALAIGRDRLLPVLRPAHT